MRDSSGCGGFADFIAVKVLLLVKIERVVKALKYLQVHCTEVRTLPIQNCNQLILKT